MAEKKKSLGMCLVEQDWQKPGTVALCRIMEDGTDIREYYIALFPYDENKISDYEDELIYYYMETPEEFVELSSPKPNNDFYIIEVLEVTTLTHIC